MRDMTRRLTAFRALKRVVVSDGWIGSVQKAQAPTASGQELCGFLFIYYFLKIFIILEILTGLVTITEVIFHLIRCIILIFDLPQILPRPGHTVVRRQANMVCQLCGEASEHCKLQKLKFFG